MLQPQQQLSCHHDAFTTGDRGGGVRLICTANLLTGILSGLACVLLFLTLGAAKASADAMVSPGHSLERTIVSHRLFFLIDRTQRLSHQDFQQGRYASLFEPLLINDPNFGISDSVHWIKIELDQQENVQSTHFWYLEIDNPHLDRVTLYIDGAPSQFAQQQQGRLVARVIPALSKSGPWFLKSTASQKASPLCI